MKKEGQMCKRRLIPKGSEEKKGKHKRKKKGLKGGGRGPHLVANFPHQRQKLQDLMEVKAWTEGRT